MTTFLLRPVTGCAPPDLHYSSARSATTVTFQQSVNSYTGTTDGLISSSGGGVGANDFTQTSTKSLIMNNVTGGYESEALIRFDGIETAIPAGSTITSATVTLTFEDFYGGHDLRAYYVKNAWTTAAKWVPRNSTQNWATPGGKGLGTDISSTPAFTDDNTDGSWPGTGILTRQYPLDAATVQGWIDNPSTNQGLLLMNAAVDKTLRVMRGTHATTSYHPLLSIDYTTGSGGGNCWTTSANGSFINTSFAAKSAFIGEFDATPSTANMDGVIGYSSGPANPANGYSDLQVIVRFWTTGEIQARDYDTYPTSSFTYTPGIKYHFKIQIDDVSARTYSVWVNATGQTPVLLGSGYRFRSDAPIVTSLDNIATRVETAGATTDVCDHTETPTGGGGGGGPGAHPRIFLDAGTLSQLVDRSNNPATNAAWLTLKAKCDAYIQPGTTIAPFPTDHVSECLSECSVSSGNICCGYDGTKLHSSLLNLGLCYQMGRQRGELNTEAWGDKGVQVLTALAAYDAYGANDGFQSRFLGTALAIGYDWFYPKLDATLKTNIANALKGWIQYPTTGTDRISQPGCVHDFWGEHHPTGNYFAGWYAAKAYASLALEGETTDQYIIDMLPDWLNRVHYGGDNSLPPSYNKCDTNQTFVPGKFYGVAQHHTRYVNGGGFPGGWEYGGLAVQNMSEPALAFLSAHNGQNIINDTTPGTPQYEYPLNTAQFLMHATWPSRAYMDDRDTIKYTGNCPGYATPPGALATTLTNLLSKPSWGKSFKSAFQDYANRMRSQFGTFVGGDVPQQWLDFLYWDPAAPSVDYTTVEPLSMLFDNTYATMRSDWGTSATWASLRATAIQDGNTNQYMDAGSLVITRGDTPFIVNPGFLDRCYGTVAPQNWFDTMNADVFGGTAHRQIFNIFYTSTSTGQNYVQLGANATDPATKISFHDPHTDYVWTRAQDLEDLYTGVTNWTRDVTYFRTGGGSLFVVYDRTNAACGTPRLAWHTPPQPTLVSGSNPPRWDVNDTMVGYKGAITAALIANASTGAAISPVTTSVVDNVFSSGKMYRLNIKPSTCATDLRWVTVLDAASSSGAVHTTTALNLSNAKGVILQSSASNKVALFGVNAPPSTAIVGTVQFQTPAITSRTTHVVVADLVAGATYNVTAPIASGNHTVTITQQAGGSFTATSSGTLHVLLNGTTGAVTQGN